MQKIKGLNQEIRKIYAFIGNYDDGPTNQTTDKRTMDTRAHREVTLPITIEELTLLPHCLIMTSLVYKNELDNNQALLMVFEYIFILINGHFRLAKLWKMLHRNPSNKSIFFGTRCDLLYVQFSPHSKLPVFELPKSLPFN